jgi:hypothetical protein
MKLEFCRQIFEKYFNTKFYENPSRGSKVIPCGWTEGHDEANSRFSQFLEQAYKLTFFLRCYHRKTCRCPVDKRQRKFHADLQNVVVRNLSTLTAISVRSSKPFQVTVLRYILEILLVCERIVHPDII